VCVVENNLIFKSSIFEYKSQVYVKFNKKTAPSQRNEAAWGEGSSEKCAPDKKCEHENDIASVPKIPLFWLAAKTTWETF